MLRIAIIIPALNEQEAIERVLAAIPRDQVVQILVADNGSTDLTASRAQQAGATVVHVPTRGYGHACLGALRHLDEAVDTVVFLDGDGSDYPEELPTLLEPLREGRADLVVGSRWLGTRRPGAMPIHQLFGNWIAAYTIRLLYGVRVTDLGPFRVIRRTLLDRLRMRPAAYRWTTEMLVKSLRSGAGYEEVPVSYRPRIGKSKISGNLRASLLAGWSILSTALYYAPGLPFYRPRAGSDARA